MENRQNRTFLIAAIIISALLLSGTMLFLGIQLRRSAAGIDPVELDSRIDQGIERYIKKQLEKQRQNQVAQQKRVEQVRPVMAQRDHIYGDPGAVVSLIEYSDFECPYCKRFHPIPAKIVDQYQGKVNWVFRHFPLEIHNPAAQEEAEAAECAAEQGGDKVFYEYSDLLFERTRSNGRGIARSGLSGLAKELGLKIEQFNACLSAGKFSNRVKSDYNEGLKLGISGTPTVVLLNNQTKDALIKAGAYPVEALAKDIDHLLKVGTGAK